MTSRAPRDWTDVARGFGAVAWGPRGPRPLRALVDQWCALLGLDPADVVPPPALARISVVLRAHDDAGALERALGSLLGADLRAQTNAAAAAATEPVSWRDRLGRWGSARDDAACDGAAGLELTAFQAALAGLIVVGVGHALHRLGAAGGAATIDTRGTTQAPHVVVVTVAASEAELLHAIRARGSLEPGTAERLYQAARYLWYGAEGQLETSALRPWFDGTREPARGDEYDVHLVRIGLPAPDPRFLPGVSTIDRLDGFLTLGARGAPARVSPPLPSEVYADTGFYQK